MLEHTHASDSAAALIAAYGRQARERVLAMIETAVRDHDLAAAKRWDAIGHCVDQRLRA